MANKSPLEFAKDWEPYNGLFGSHNPAYHGFASLLGFLSIEIWSPYLYYMSTMSLLQILLVWQMIIIFSPHAHAWPFQPSNSLIFNLFFQYLNINSYIAHFARSYGYSIRKYALVQCLWRDRLVIHECKQNMTSLRGQAGWAKMMSLRGKLMALACHLTKFVNKAE